MSGQGHNGVNSDQLRAIIERIEKLEDEKRAIADDIKEIYAEAKGNGFCSKTIKRVVALRRQDRDKRREETEMLKLYCDAIQLELSL